MTRRIAITGASGFLGRALSRSLTASGHEVVSIGRSATSRVVWNPARGEIDRDGLAGASAIIHLAGASIAQRWTDRTKQEIRDSRVLGTALIARTVAALDPRPEVLVSMSGIGIYGDTGEREVDEGAPAGGGFLGALAREWEAAAEPARQAGVRVVHPRLGVVLHADGGALAKLRPVFLAGAGGKLGTGRQYMPWISLHDAVAALAFLVTHPGADGAWNVVAPHPVTNTEFTEALARALHRPALFAVPEFAIRLAFGDMGVETLLGGQRARPARLLEAGFRFQHPDIGSALAAAGL